MPLISVLMPVHNAQSTLAPAVSSILNQTERDLELIIVDDGSTDGTSKILSNIKDRRVKVVAQATNGGIANALNRAIDLSCGKYLARMDADDESLPERLERQLVVMESQEHIAVLGTQMRTMGPGSVVWRQPLTPGGIKARLLFGPPVHHPTVMIARDRVPESALTYEASWVPAEDYRLWSRLLVDHGCVFGNLPEALVRYRSKALSKAEFNILQEERSFACSWSIAESLGFSMEMDSKEPLRAFCGHQLHQPPAFSRLVDFAGRLETLVCQSDWVSKSEFEKEIRRRWYEIGKRNGACHVEIGRDSLNPRAVHYLLNLSLGSVARKARRQTFLRSLFGAFQGLRSSSKTSKHRP